MDGFICFTFTTLVTAEARPWQSVRPLAHVAGRNLLPAAPGEGHILDGGTRRLVSDGCVWTKRLWRGGGNLLLAALLIPIGLDPGRGLARGYHGRRFIH